MALVRFKGIALDLGGTQYVVPPIALGALEQMHERLRGFTGDPSDLAQVATVVDAAHASLSRNYPGIAREQVAELIDVGNMIDVFSAVMDVSGMRRKAAEASNAGPAAAEGAPQGE